MSSDWIVLSVDEPTEGVVIEALRHVVDAVDMRPSEDGHYLELLDDRSVTLLVIERAKLVHTTAELARLHPGADVSAPEGSVGIPDLFTSPGAADGPSPVWWQDLHASANVPRTDHLAEALAHAVARRCRGVVVAPRTAPRHPLIGENP